MARKKNIKVIETNYLVVRMILSAILIIAFLLTLFLSGILNPNVVNFKKYDFEIHFIDVGQGDSIFIRMPNNQTMLIDCGPNYKSNQVVTYLDNLFESENIKEITYFVLTHQDADHVGQAKSIFENFDVKTLYRPKILCADEVKILNNDMNYRYSDTIVYNDAIMAGYDEGCKIIYNQEGIKFYDSDLNIEFLSPAKDKYNEFNDYSPMIMVTYKSAKFLLTGDAEINAEKEVIEKYSTKLKADVLKVGHHGSSTSTSDEFLSYVKPKYSIISAGKNNQYKLPHSDTITKLKAIDSEILQTFDLGSIVFSVDNNGKILLSHQNKTNIDLPLLVVAFSMAFIIVWGFKVNKKKTKATDKADDLI